MRLLKVKSSPVKWVDPREVRKAFDEDRPMPERVESLEVIDLTGKVVSVAWETERIMSDVWAQYRNVCFWNGSEIERTWSAGDGSVNPFFIGEPVVDATPEVMVEVEAFRAKKAEEARLQREQERKEKEEREARRVDSGKRLRVVRGRKVPIGTEGVCFWTGFDSFRKRNVGIATTDRKDDRGRFADVVWTAASNCEVVL